MSYSATVLGLSPTLYARLSETSGSFADSSGHGYTGTAGTVTRGVAGLVAGDADKAVTISNATGSSVDFGTAVSALMAGTASWSVVVGVKPDGTGASSIYRRILNCVNGGGDGGIDIALGKTGTGNDNKPFVQRYASGSSPAVYASQAIAAGSTALVAVTYDGSTLRIYVNGTLGGSIAATGSSGTPGTFRLGNTVATAANGFGGTLDELAFWSGTVLSATDLSTLYTRFSTAPTVPAATGTLYASGTHGGVACGGDKYARAVMVYDHPNTTDDVSSVVVERSTDGVTWADITAHSLLTSLGSNDFKVIDLRPQYGSQSVAYGGTAHYRVSPTNGAGTGAATSAVTVTTDVDKQAVRSANYAVHSSQMAGSYVASKAYPAGHGVYPGMALLTMALAYYEDRAAQYLTDVTNEFNYIKNSLTLADGLIQFPDYTDGIYPDHHCRTVFQAAVAVRLLRMAGATTEASTIIAQCDVWAKAALDNLNSGSPYVSVTLAGFNPDSMNAWAASTSYGIGAVVRPTTRNGRSYICTATHTSGTTEPTWPTTDFATVGNWQETGCRNPAWQASAAYTAGRIVRPSTYNGRTYRAMTDGISAGSEPTWPTTTGGTVTDGTVTWRETSATGVAFPELFSNSAGHAALTTPPPLTINQQIEIGAMYAVLCNDSESAFYSAGTYRTKAQTVIGGVMALATALQCDSGAIPIGDGPGYGAGSGGAIASAPSNGPKTMTVYGGFDTETASVIYKLSGSQHPAHQLWMNRACDWFATMETEPLVGINHDGLVGVPGLSDVLFRTAAKRLMGRDTTSIENIAYSAAFWNGDSDLWVDPYQANGASTSSTINPSEAIWEAEAIRQAVIDVVALDATSGTAAAQGGTSTVSQVKYLTCTGGTATASGGTATPTARLTATSGTATAAGGTVSTSRTLATSGGTATGTGGTSTASASSGASLAASAGLATATGGTVTTNRTLASSGGTATAAGGTSTATTPSGAWTGPAPRVPATITLDAHASTTSLDAHQSTLTLHPTGGTLTLHAHTSRVALHDHRNTLTLEP